MWRKQKKQKKPNARKNRWEEECCNNKEQHHDAIDWSYTINKIISFSQTTFFLCATGLDEVRYEKKIQTQHLSMVI